jgi:hypothetical protein
MVYCNSSLIESHDVNEAVVCVNDETLKVCHSFSTFRAMRSLTRVVWCNVRPRMPSLSQDWKSVYSQQYVVLKVTLYMSWFSRFITLYKALRPALLVFGTSRSPLSGVPLVTHKTRR